MQETRLPALLAGGEKRSKDKHTLIVGSDDVLAQEGSNLLGVRSPSRAGQQRKAELRLNQGFGHQGPYPGEPRTLSLSVCCL